MAKFSELRVKFTGDTANLKDAFRQVNAELSEAARQAGRSSIGWQQLGKSMSDIGQRLTIGLTAPIVGFGAAALKMAGQMEQTEVAFRTMLKSGTAATAMLKDLKQFAATTPFQFTELTDASRRMMALGFSAKEVIPTLRTIGDAAGALGIGAEGINRIVLALGQMKAKGTVQAEEMRQLAEAGIPAWDALAKKLNTDVAGAMKLVEQRAVSSAVGIEAALGAMNDNFGGGMEAQAKTLVGLWSNVKDSVTFALADIGKVLLPTAKSMVSDFLVPAIAGAKDMASAFAALPAPVQTGTLAMAAFLAAVGPMSWAIGGTVNGIVAMGAAWKTAAVALTAARIVVLGLADAIGVKLVASIGVAQLSAAGMVAVFGAWAAAVAALTFEIKYLWDAYAQFRQGNKVLEDSQKSAGESMALLATKVRQLGIDITDLKKQYTSGEISSDTYRRELMKLAAAHGETAAAVKVTAAEFDEAAKKLGLTTTKQLTQQLKEAKEALSVVAIAYKNGAASAEDMAAAQSRVQQINELLHPSIKRVTEALNGMAGAMQGPETLWEELAAVIQQNQLGEATDQINRMAEAWKHAELAKAGALRVETIPLELKPKLTIEPNAVDLSAMDRETSIRRATDALKDMGIQYKILGKEWKTSGALQKQALQGVSTALTDMTRGIADVIFQGGKMGDVFKRLATEIGKSLTRLVLEQALIPIRKELSNIIGIGASAGTASIGAATSAAGSAAGGVAGGIGGGASSAAASGVMGMVGVVAGVVSAVSSVIGNFQMAGMNKSLDVIVQHTLRTANQLIYGIQPSLNQWLPGVQGIQDRLVDLANIMNGGGMTFAGGGYGVSAGSIKIEIGNVYGGPAGLDSLTDEIVRRLQARGLRIG